MNIGITGCLGWLGRNLTTSLEEGNRDYKESKLKANYRLMDIRADGKITYLGDIRRYRDCIEFTNDVDILVHTAGIIHPKKVRDFYDVNVKGTDNLVRASMKNGVKQFIYISSNSAMGVCDYVMTEETHNDPYMNYGKSKSIAEQLLWDNSGYGMDITILRPCWFYGEGQPDRQTKLFKMIQGGRPMIFGDGNNLRSMTYIGNLCHAIYLSIKNNHHLPFPESYWISDSRPYTTNEIYETIAKLLNVDDYKPIYISDIACRIGRFGDRALQKIGRYNSYVHVLGEMDQSIACSIYKAKKELGYDPNINLELGMKRSIEWCTDNGKL